MLTNDQKVEFERIGADTVRLLLANDARSGRGSSVGGLSIGETTRGDVYDWLAVKQREEEKERATALFWAKAAGWTSVVAILSVLILLI